MYGMTLRRIADACGGVLHIQKGKEALADSKVTSIVTDSRKAGAGSVFAAIKGERVDGHSFIGQVFGQGAACVISERELPEAAGCWILVPSTLTALKGIAEYYRRALGVQVVGVTGSVGKTSTKEMIASVLAQHFRVHKTRGNFNNELGLPLTIFDLTREHEIAVLEMGISDFGEMHRLAQIARPDTCVITNIGQCHLEFLHDRDGVLRAKTEIFDFLEEGGAIILNGNDDKLRRVRHVKGIEPVFYGIPAQDDVDVVNAQADPEDKDKNSDQNIEKNNDKEVPAVSLQVYATDLQPLGLGGIRARIHTGAGDFAVTIPVPGRHSVMNALAGTAVGLRYGLTLEEIRRGIESVERVDGRMHVIETKRFTVIDDCYNANPVSMKASLDVLADVKETLDKAVPRSDLHAEGGRQGRRAAVLGDMFELGSDELALHAGVGEHAAALGIEVLCCVGERCRSMYEAAKEKVSEQAAALQDVSAQGASDAARRSAGTDIRWFQDVDAFLAEKDTLLRAGDTVLVKASHAMGFERIVRALEEP